VAQAVHTHNTASRSTSGAADHDEEDKNTNTPLLSSSSSINSSSSSSVLSAQLSPQSYTAAADLARQLRSICGTHQTLLEAVQECSGSFGAACSLHPLLCPAGGQKWLVVAAHMAAAG
jgi:hypothetical protein